MGITLAILRACGNSPAEKEQFIISASGVATLPILKLAYIRINVVHSLTMGCANCLTHRYHFLGAGRAEPKRTQERRFEGPFEVTRRRRYFFSLNLGNVHKVIIKLVSYCISVLDPNAIDIQRIDFSILFPHICNSSNSRCLLFHSIFMVYSKVTVFPVIE